MFESERIERAALMDLHDAASPEMKARLQLETIDVDGAFVSVAGALPPSAIVINRTLGSGLSEPATANTVRDIVNAYRNAGVERYFVQHHPDASPATLAQLYEDVGLIKVRGWQKFSRAAAPLEQRETDLEVRPANANDGEAFARIVCDAFDLGDAAIPWLARLPGRDHWHAYMSFENGTPAGAGALFVKDGIGWSDFGATAPEFRRRGSQGAILTRRLQLALDLGCAKVFTCTGEAASGDEQHSYRNIERAGFRREYLRENFAPW